MKDNSGLLAETEEEGYELRREQVESELIELGRRKFLSCF